MLPSFPTEPCIICLNRTEKLCQRCRRVHYCSRECQLADLPVHRVFCRAIIDHVTPPKKHRAFLFDSVPIKTDGRAVIVDHSCDHPLPAGKPDGPDPKLAFKRYAHRIASVYMRLPYDENAKLEYDIITTNYRTGQKLDRTLVLFSRKDGGMPLPDGNLHTKDPLYLELLRGFRCEPLNNILKAVYEKRDYELFGPFVLCSFGAEDGVPRDANLEDVRHMVDYLGRYGRARPEEWAFRDHAAWLHLHGDERVHRFSRGHVFVPTRPLPRSDTFPDSLDPAIIKAQLKKDLRSDATEEDSWNMGGLELQCANNMIKHNCEAMTPIGVNPYSPL
ncbi:hypothetical protein PG988_006229 [Apiospora saccharicola]